MEHRCRSLFTSATANTGLPTFARNDGRDGLKPVSRARLRTRREQIAARRLTANEARRNQATRERAFEFSARFRAPLASPGVIECRDVRRDLDADGVRCRSTSAVMRDEPRRPQT